MGFLQGKRALIVGVASHRSIAWGVAGAFRREGAELAFACQNEKLRARVEDMAVELGSRLTTACDLASDEQIEGLFGWLRQNGWDRIDIIVHSAAFAPPGQLEGDFLDDISREGFRVAHDVSAYGFVALAKAARPMLAERASLLAMSYLGALRAVPHYNVMGLAKASLEASVRYLAASLGPAGIRVNAISAGPIRTAAAKGVGDFGSMLDYAGRNSPLRRNVTIEEVGNAAAFLCSDLASGISGDVLYVDAGFHVMAMAVPDA